MLPAEDFVRNCGGAASASVESESFSHPPTGRGQREVGEMEDIGDVLDLDRYPLDRPASRGAGHWWRNAAPRSTVTACSTWRA